MTLRGTKGTSYRAPNLRERFLAGTTGFGNVYRSMCGSMVMLVIAILLNPGQRLIHITVLKMIRVMLKLYYLSVPLMALNPTSLGLGQDGTEKFNSSNSTEVVSGGSLGLK